MSEAPDLEWISLATIAREWGRIGCIGFGGPPAHISLLRKLCVEQRGWLSAQEFEDGIAATNLLPGPASTQLAIFCAWRLRGPLGGVLGGACFIVPGLVVILALSALFLARDRRSWWPVPPPGPAPRCPQSPYRPRPGWSRPASLAPAQPGELGSAGSSTSWPARWRRLPSDPTWSW
jgi:chromate transporter